MQVLVERHALKDDQWHRPQRWVVILTHVLSLITHYHCMHCHRHPPALIPSALPYRRIIEYPLRAPILPFPAPISRSPGTNEQGFLDSEPGARSPQLLHSILHYMIFHA